MLPLLVFKPVWPFGSRKAHTLADGALWFLQWDLITSSSALLLWAFTLRTEAEGSKVMFYQFALGLILSLVFSVAVGPSGAAVLALWARDELVFGKWEHEKQTALAKKNT